MRSFVWALVVSGGLATSWLATAADDIGLRAWQLESKGDASGARSLLQHDARATNASPETLKAYAEFLDRHHDPSTREAYERLLATATGAEKMSAARRLVLLDVYAEDRPAAEKHLEQYRQAGGKDLALPAPKPAPAAPAAADKKQTILIPGPIRSFSRMAALSPDMNPEDLASALARNIVTNGYQATSSNEALEQTEYLKLVVRYLTQARELDKLAGADKMMRIETCESAQTNDLLRVLGYRMRGACGSDVVLETVNATRAFLTIDSGFPLALLEQALRTNRPFTYDYRPTEVPILYGPDYWLSAKDKQGEFIDIFIGDPSLCRLYLGLSKLDPQTADDLKKTVAIQKIRAFAHVLDFYGGMFEIRDGKAVVPGGARSEKAWTDLVGVSPDKGAAFFERLVAREDGWLASYFDSLARITDSPVNGPVQQYLTEPERLKRFYGAIRGKVTSPGPARPVFRSNTDMMMLTSRLRLDPDGKPHVPGGVDVWRKLFINHPAHAKYDQKLTKTASAWKDGDDVVEALFGLTRKSVENEPLKIYMALSDVDRRRPQPLDAEAADRMAREYTQFGAQYSLFAEAPELTNASIVAYLDIAAGINQIKDLGLRGNAAGTFQALVAMWQIFYRQEAISTADADTSFTRIVAEFGKARNEGEVFDAGRSGVKTLLTATRSAPTASPQDRLIDLLAGAAEPADADSHLQMVEEMIRIFEAQRLISLKTIFDLVDNLEGLSRGEKVNQQLIAKAAARIGEIQLPRASMSGAEKNALAFGYWPEKHIEQQRKVNLRAMIEKSATDPKKMDDIRGTLAPFLRDTLVGLSYIHYAPPGAQILHTNPLFVRSHDFIGLQGANQTWKNTELLGNGWPTSAGGKLVGSLAGVPYALAEAEQNFLIPSKEQALIWGDLVPQMILSATVPRYWNVTPGQLHWVALHMNYTENKMAESVLNPGQRLAFLDALDRHAAPFRVRKIGRLLEAGEVKAAVDNIMPAEMFAVATDMIAVGKSEDSPIAREIRREAAESPKQLSYTGISRAFGTPKPTLANSYSPQLLNLRTFPTLMGYSSRIMAESWESNLLYYASVADELQIPPSQLNVLVPAWTQLTVERIFATHLEDWPALLRSLRVVGDEVRLKSRKQIAAAAGGQ